MTSLGALLTSLGAMVRISVRRSRADWPIVLAAGWFCLLAATLLAAGAMYATAVSTAGLQRILADAPTADANVAVSARVEPDAFQADDATVTAALNDAMGDVGGTVWRLARSDSFALPVQPAEGVRNLAVLGATEGIESRTTLLEGPRAPTGQAIPVSISESVAGALSLELGDQLELESRAAGGFVATVEVAGIFRVNDPGDPFWWGELQATEGLVSSDRFDTYGPFYASLDDLLQRATPAEIEVTWRAAPNVSQLTTDDIEALDAGVGGLRDRLRTELGSAVTVETGLPEILAETERSLLVSRAGVLLLSVQLVVLAAYAVLLSAGLLLDRRRVDSAMLRSRGAGRWHLLALASIEALLLTATAAIAAPWLASAALRAFNLGGPLADIGLHIEPTVATDAYIAAGAAAVLCFFALTLPTLRNPRALSTVQGDQARGPTTGIGQRLGLDLALLAVAGIALWQLRHYGAPLTRTVQGTLGLDPLLVATPAIGLLAGGVVALRIVPLAAQLVERATVRARGLVPALGARQLARRPLRYTRSALLLMLAVALGVFSVCYTWTWSLSQRDQAAFQVGADLRVEPGTRSESMPRWALDAAYAGLPGVTERLPVDHDSIRVGRGDQSAQIVALDAGVGPRVATLRQDLAASSVADLLAPLAAARPEIETVPLPGEPRRLRVTAELEIRSLDRQEFDEELGVPVFVEATLDEIGGWRGLGLSAVVRDARGLLHRFDAAPAVVADGAQVLEVPLGDPDAPAAAAFAWPLELLAIEVSVSLPEGFQAPDATLFVGDLEVAGAYGPFRPVDIALPSGWRTTSAFFGRPHETVATANRGGSLEAPSGVDGLAIFPGIDQFGRASVVTFAPAALDDLNGLVVPVVASDAYLEASAGALGTEQTLTIDGVRRTLLPTASVRAVPTGDPAAPTLLMDLPTLSLLRYEGNDAVDPLDEWWLAVEPAARPDVVSTLERAPFGSRSVVSTDDRHRLLSTDPVALGIIGALAIGFVAAALFAVVGFMVSAAVSARERVAEFALLRALGLSPVQLSVWLSLENAVLASVSLVTGSLLGLLISWVVLPFITVTQGAQTPFPPIDIAVPWGVIGILEIASIVALAGTVIALAWMLRRTAVASILRIGED